MSRFPIPRSIEELPDEGGAFAPALRGAVPYAPGFFLTLATSPPALEALLAMSKALAGAGFLSTTRESIGIAISSVNGADYSRRTYEAAARAQGLDDAEIEANRNGRSNEPKADVAIRFAHALSLNRGHVSDADVAAVRAAGYSDAQVIALVTQVALTTYSNLLNNLFDNPVDLPGPP